MAFKFFLIKGLSNFFLNCLQDNFETIKYGLQNLQICIEITADFVSLLLFCLNDFKKYEDFKKKIWVAYS